MTKSHVLEESLSTFTDKTCYDITYKEFVDFIYDDNKNDKDKEEASRLMAEFSELCGDIRSKTYFSIYKKLFLLRSSLETLDVCKMAVCHAVTQPIIDYLKKHNVRITTQTLTKDILLLIDAQMQRIALKTKEAQAELNRCVQDNKKGRESTKSDYYSLLANISQSVGFSVPETTLAGIVAEHIRQLNRQKYNESRSSNAVSK